MFLDYTIVAFSDREKNAKDLYFNISITVQCHSNFYTYVTNILQIYFSAIFL